MIAATAEDVRVIEQMLAALCEEDLLYYSHSPHGRIDGSLLNYLKRGILSSHLFLPPPRGLPTHYALSVTLRHLTSVGAGAMNFSAK